MAKDSSFEAWWETLVSKALKQEPLEVKVYPKAILVEGRLISEYAVWFNALGIRRAVIRFPLKALDPTSVPREVHLLRIGERWHIAAFGASSLFEGRKEER